MSNNSHAAMEYTYVDVEEDLLKEKEYCTCQIKNKKILNCKNIRHMQIIEYKKRAKGKHSALTL